jgi:hypothetical protein
VDDGDAAVDVDGRALQPDRFSRPIDIAPGHHVLTARKTGFTTSRREVDVAAGGTVGVVLRLEPMSPEAIGYDAPEGGGAHGNGDGTAASYRVPLLITGTAVSLVALGAGIALNLAANQKADYAHAEQGAIAGAGGTTSTCLVPPAGFGAACGTLHDALVARDRDANLAIAAYATGGVVAAATIAYAVWPLLRPEKRRSTFASSVRPAPMVGPSVGGLAIAGVF